MTESFATKLLSTSDFAHGQYPYKDFTIFAEVLTADNNKRENVCLSACYDPHMRLNFRYEEAFNIKNLFQSPKQITITGEYFTNPCELLALQTVHSSDTGTAITCTPKQEPMLLQFDNSAAKVEAVVLNGPELLWSGMRLDFVYKEYRLSLMDFENTKELRKQSTTLKKENIATGSILLHEKKNNNIDPGAALEAINKLDQFLMFVKGTHCGIGNISGYTNDNKIAFVYLGFTRLDQFVSSVGWCDQTVVKELPKVFECYCDALENSKYAKTLLTAIEFYRASNISRESSLEMALVASHASLETLVQHILTTKAGWSSNMLGKQISFHDKLRAAVKFVGLKDEPLRHLTELQARSKADSNADAYELLSKFRNRIVHQGKQFKYSGEELHEVWLLAQWLSEIFIFYWIGYRGKMNDRRHYTGWRGEYIGNVPLPPI